MQQAGFVQELVNAIAMQGRRILDLGTRESDGDRLLSLCEGLLSTAGEASGMAAAAEVLQLFDRLPAEERLRFFRSLASGFGVDADAVVAAADSYRANPTPAAMQRLQEVVEPRRQELLRRINLAPGGTEGLVRMRESLLGMLASEPNLMEVDRDFVHLFQSWFNRGFLELRRIDWDTPASILEKIIRYEAVHRIHGWDELRQRIDPPDRRLYAFFHPRLSNEPLIFVEVALMPDMPASIDEILTEDRVPVTLDRARTAVFYSISNCQVGLRGVSFGNFLIKQVVEDLRREFAGLRTFVTLSPIPRLAAWVQKAEPADHPAIEAALAEVKQLQALEKPSEEDFAHLEQALPRVTAYYLLYAKGSRGEPFDPVARFHLGNGARLERINFFADRSATALRNSFGMMVNYAYRPGDIERNHEAFAQSGEVVAATAVTSLLRRGTFASKLGSLA